MSAVAEYIGYAVMVLASLAALCGLAWLTMNLIWRTHRNEMEEFAQSRPPIAKDAAEPECENCNQLVRALREATESPTFMGEPVIQLSQASGWLWTHTKSGGEYTMLGAALLQTDTPLTDMARLCVYQGKDGAMWVRPATEFNERFKRTRPLATPAAGAGGAGVMDARPDSFHSDSGECDRVQGPGPTDAINYKGMWLAAVSTLAKIDALLGLPEDGCNDPDMTLSALQDYMAGIKDIVGSSAFTIEDVRGWIAQGQARALAIDPDAAILAKGGDQGEGK